MVFDQLKTLLFLMILNISPDFYIFSKQVVSLLKSIKMNNAALEDAIVDALKTVYDPEIPVDVYELGLIYEIIINDDKSVNIDMTLTSPNCPVAESMPKEVEDTVAIVPGVKSAKVKVVFDPPWDQNMMSEEAKLELGFL